MFQTLLFLSALPGQTINYSLSITNEGTEATNNTLIAIPIRQPQFSIQDQQ